MKYLPLFFLVCPIFQMNAQISADNVAGTYEMNFEATNGLIIEKLTLNPDGTFVFHGYERIDQRLTPEGNKYGKGVWSIDGKIITFNAKQDDFDEKYTLDFTNSLARFDNKLIEAKYGKESKISIRFYKSEIPWMKGRMYLKIE